LSTIAELSTIPAKDPTREAAGTSPVPPRLRRRSPARERVVEALREEIMLGRLADGERLIEDQIARRLSTSRGPVREALRQLEHEGLVVSYPYRGAVVLGVSDEEVQHVLIPIRLTLERFSFLKALERMDEADFAELAKEVWLMGEAARSNDVMASVEADIRFHQFVLSRSGQPHTAQLWGAIAPRIRAYFFRYGSRSDLGQIALEHGELLAAMQTRKRGVVGKALEQHIAVQVPPSPGPRADG
jgi:DNA-binding GntR family transcriptional regulator